MLLVAFGKTGEESFAHIRFAIAIRVLGIKDLGGGADDDAFTPRHNPGGKIYSFKEDG